MESRYRRRSTPYWVRVRLKSCFEHHVQTDLVAESKAIDDGLGRVDGCHLDAVDVHAFDTIGEGNVSHARDPDSGLVQTRSHHVRRERDPDLVAFLTCNLVYSWRSHVEINEA